MKDFKETFIKVEADVRTSIEIIHKSGHRIGLVVNKESKLLGTVTDGDIRRALLNKIDMSESVLKIMNEKPTFSSKRETSEEKIKININEEKKQQPSKEIQKKVAEKEKKIKPEKQLKNDKTIKEFVESKKPIKEETKVKQASEFEKNEM